MKTAAPKWIFCAMFSLGLFCAPLSGLLVDPRKYEGGRSRDATARTIRNNSILASLIGELRTSASDMMFLKIERYLHGGVAYRTHNCSQVQSAANIGMEGIVPPSTSPSVHDDHEGHMHDAHDHDGDHAGCQVCAHGHHSHDETVIPGAGSDFRGVIGWLHREVKPWRDPVEPHLHSDGSELLPWFRVMTLMDPHYVMGYAVGGWWVSQHDENASLAYLREGIEKNPDAFQIRLTRGLLQLRILRRQGTLDPELLASAFADIRAAVRLGLAQRPLPFDGNAAGHSGWTAMQEQDLWTACQTSVLMEKHYGRPSEAERLAQKYYQIFPENKVLRGHLGVAP